MGWGMFERSNGRLNYEFVAGVPAMRFKIAFRETTPYLGRNAMMREVRIPGLVNGARCSRIWNQGNAVLHRGPT